ncbi:phage baseplate protein [Aureimonas ureilytica]|uniref:phage baseplate protein n=1 Tax=Aureimonas ureilytica TaxID=401562 RepID=UPI000371E1B5|nr:hypothetical protein [Aureimonas ureilytica]
MSVIAISRAIGPVPLAVVLVEQHESELEITENAVEFGAKVTDHAYSQPKRLTLEVADSSATATWQALKRLQESRVPFNLVTGLDLYRDMLIRRLSADRDLKTSQILRAKVELQEVIIVDTAQAAATGEGGGKSAAGGKANPGGKDSRRAATPAAGRSSADNANRAAGAVKRGDNATKTVAPERGRSILSQVFG